MNGVDVLLMLAFLAIVGLLWLDFQTDLDERLDAAGDAEGSR